MFEPSCPRVSREAPVDVASSLLALQEHVCPVIARRLGRAQRVFRDLMSEPQVTLDRRVAMQTASESETRIAISRSA